MNELQVALKFIDERIRVWHSLPKTKEKMLKQLKSFFSKTFSKQPAARPEAPKPAATKEAHQAAPLPAKAKSAPATNTVRPASAPAKTPTAAPVTAPPGTPEETFYLPVKVVLNRLPAALTALVKSPGNGDLALSLKKILTQLPQGAVKLTFGEIRQAAPSGTFLDITSQDQTIVELPLPDILSRLSPAHLSRRPAQKTIEVPPEVGNVFGPRGEQLTQPSSDTTIRKAAPAATPKPAAPAPTLPKLPAAPAAPSIPKPTVPAPKIAPSSLPSPPAGKPAPAIPAPKIPAPSLPKVAPAVAKESDPLTAMPPIPQDQTQFFLNKDSSAVGEVLTVPLVSLTDGWPQNIKDEISGSKLGDSSVGLPMERIETGLKTGKLSFSWKEIAGWLKPNPFTSQLNADTTVELPLKVIAPLFISQHRPVKTQKKLTIDQTIPDVFAGRKAPEAATPVAESVPTAPKPALPSPPTAAVAPSALPKAPAAIPPANLPKPSITASSLPKPPVPQPPKSSPAPVSAPAVAAPTAASPKEAASLGELFGEPAKKDWSPREIVHKTNGLKGISGSIVVLSDGLMVAGELPAPFRAETTAAFLPQIFGRMNQYAKELNLGEMNTVTVECDKAPLQITKTGILFLGVIGKPGEPLPVGQIKLIASELAKQNK